MHSFTALFALVATLAVTSTSAKLQGAGAVNLSRFHRREAAVVPGAHRPRSAPLAHSSEAKGVQRRVRRSSKSKKRSRCSGRSNEKTAKATSSDHSTTAASTSSTASEASTSSKASKSAASQPAAVSFAAKTVKSSSSSSSSNYTLAQSSHGGSDSFFNDWEFFSQADPTHGAVEYVTSDVAWKNGLVSSEKNKTVLRVDSWSELGYGENRQSVRITSKEKVSFGSIVVVDVESMPYGPAVWPAFWTVGDNWPSGGEIDIIEGVNKQSQNQYTLHTGDGCTASQNTKALGVILATNCDASVNSNTGCGVQDPSTSSFGKALNDNGGGVFAMVWDDDGVKMFFFPRGEIPDDLTSDSPSPSSWGEPRAHWNSLSCDPEKYFTAQTIVINITLGGDWAGSTYVQDGYSGDWKTAVQDPSNYKTARWELNYVKVFEKKSSSSSS
ncbi:hypothetical protein JCM10207_001166 [Rhodosporidiobolus poonsookiae]